MMNLKTQINFLIICYKKKIKMTIILIKEITL
jgi:hypothetical protein